MEQEGKRCCGETWSAPGLEVCPNCDKPFGVSSEIMEYLREAEAAVDMVEARQDRHTYFGHGQDKIIEGLIEALRNLINAIALDRGIERE